MKNRFVLVVIITILMVTLGFRKSNAIENKPIAYSGKLNLSWYHIFSSERERGLNFLFYGVERFKTSYELVFEYKIDNNNRSIEIILVDKIDRGECQCFSVGDGGDACMDWDGLCEPSGNFYVPENLLIEGEYTFIVRTLNYTVRSEFFITKEKATLNIPENNYISSDIKEAFIAPPNLLYGRIIVDGGHNKNIVEDFLDDIRSLGQKDTIWTNPHITITDVDEAGKPNNYFFPSSDRYSIGFLMTQTSDFLTIFELAEIYIKKFSITGYPYMSLASTNGDQASLSDTHKYAWIVENEPINADHIEIPVLKAYASDGILYISGIQAGKPVSIYSVMGQLVYRNVAKAETEQIFMNKSGIYIVVSGNQTAKVIIK